MLGEQPFQNGAAVLVRLGEQFPAVCLQNVESDVMRVFELERCVSSGPLTVRHGV